MRAISLAVVGRDLDFQICRAFDHVLVGHDVTGWIDNESRAQTLQGLPDYSRTSAVVAEKLRIKIFDRVADSAVDYPFSVDVHDRGQDLRYGQHRWLGRRIGLRPT